MYESLKNMCEKYPNFTEGLGYFYYWDGKSKQGSVKMFSYVCERCCEDSNVAVVLVNISGKILCRKSHIKQGTLPCGCSPNRPLALRKLGIDEYVGSTFKVNNTKYTVLSEAHKNSSGNSYYEYICHTCIKDEELYPKDYKMLALKGNINKGELPCSCPTTIGNLDQRRGEILIQRSCNKFNDTFIEMSSKFWTGAKTCITLYCENGHTYGRVVKDYIYTNSRGCPECSIDNMRFAYIHNIIRREGVISIKCGITNDPLRRFKRQNSKCLFGMEVMGVWEFPNHKSCRDAENTIKSNYQRFIMTKDQMPDGFTETFLPQDCEDIMTVYENYGGVRIKW